MTMECLQTCPLEMGPGMETSLVALEKGVATLMDG